VDSIHTGKLRAGSILAGLVWPNWNWSAPWARTGGRNGSGVVVNPEDWKIQKVLFAQCAGLELSVWLGK
jgi:hypothetical protein